MAVISLNGFRAINETYGHITGDALLVEVGAALQKRAIGDDVVARLAGDTFGIFLPGFGDEKNAHVRLRMIAEAFERPFSTGDREGKEFIPLTATIGAFVAPDRTMSIETMIAHAETAVFAAKRDRSDAICVYESGLESAEAATKRLSGEIAAAIERDEFEMYFQPHVDLETMHVAGAEALIRWNHPTRGLLLPDEFVPFAEQHNQIKAISTWVIRSVLRAAATFRAIDPAFRVYFNLSAADITDMSIVNDLRDAAARGASLENIGVELTETMAMRDVGTAVQTIKALRDLGVHVAIDDFGVGYSSLSLLKRIPVDIVKIDRSFVHEILSDPRDAAIAEAVITFGRQFGFKTLGEGVETPEQRDWLASSNCRYAQGYFIARPAPLDRFVDWLTNR
jgi:diguanylate cyclase (GGDEF)-like protein